MIKYTDEHEWIRIDGDVGTIGITDFAQNALGDVVFIELPEVGATFDKGGEAAVVESVKAASEIYAPVAGEVVATNTAIVDDPSMVNSAPTDDGWFFKLKIADAAQLDELMDQETYAAFVDELE